MTTFQLINSVIIPAVQKNGSDFDSNWTTKVADFTNVLNSCSSEVEIKKEAMVQGRKMLNLNISFIGGRCIAR